MIFRAIVILFISLSFFNRAIPLFKETKPKKMAGDSFVQKNEDVLCYNVVGMINPITNYNENYIFDSTLYVLKVDTLPQIKFWRQIMQLHQDSSLLCFANNRNIITRINNKDWNTKSDSLKRFYRDSVRIAAKLDSNSRILLTSGKKFFYDFEKTYQNFHSGINCFVENGVDPWYAQAILLIESPNKLQKSTAGAYGSFQLMKDVARMYGLKVNKQIDERANFERSAYAASSLIKTICIPKTRKLLDSLGIKDYNETELWFKLLVMHSYHAGAGNVQHALFTFMPKEGNMNLIYNLWHAQTSHFKSASQNYSQLILAAMLEMNDKSMVISKIQESIVKVKNSSSRG
ncbi:MAG: transglycosylase SLT domain-containing protein [Bacteroidetes bacterium]|nr:transglycosylase SLT domain-containing protein [Bacteroidota bacterium]